MDSPDCLLILMSIFRLLLFTFYFLVFFLFLPVLVVGSVR